MISIDCEGYEEKVIRSINFKKKIGCIIVERPSRKVHYILKRNNMIFVKRFLFDYIYINKFIFKNLLMKSNITRCQQDQFKNIFYYINLSDKLPKYITEFIH